LNFHKPVNKTSEKLTAKPHPVSHQIFDSESGLCGSVPFCAMLLHTTYIHLKHSTYHTYWIWIYTPDQIQIYLFRHKTPLIKNINEENFKFKYTFVTARDWKWSISLHVNGHLQVPVLQPIEIQPPLYKITITKQRWALIGSARSQILTFFPDRSRIVMSRDCQLKYAMP